LKHIQNNPKNNEEIWSRNCVLTHIEIKVEADACFETKIGHCFILRRIKNKRWLASRIKNKGLLALRKIEKSDLKNNKSALKDNKSALKDNKSALKNNKSALKDNKSALQKI
jgi:hypothetical protein